MNLVPDIMKRDKALIEAGILLAEDYVKKNIIETSITNKEESDHLISIISSTLQTRYKYGCEGGGFVKSVVANNLYDAVTKADRIISKNLILVVGALNFISFRDIEEIADRLISSNKN